MPGQCTLAELTCLASRAAKAIRTVVVSLPMCLVKCIGSESDCVFGLNDLVNLASHFLVVQVVYLHVPWILIADKPLAINRWTGSPCHIYHLLPS